MGIIGLSLAGGILLLWVCWRMWRDIRGAKSHDLKPSSAAAIQGAGLRNAITQIMIADISMSLDNVLGVAGRGAGGISRCW